MRHSKLVRSDESRPRLETAPTTGLDRMLCSWKPHLPAPINRDRNRGVKVSIYF